MAESKDNLGGYEKDMTDVNSFNVNTEINRSKDLMKYKYGVEEETSNKKLRQTLDDHVKIDHVSPSNKSTNRMDLVKS